MAVDAGSLGVSDLDLTGLSEEERFKVISVMKKARDFEAKEEMNLMLQPLAGQLYKYTNVMKGWQYRWFVLEPNQGQFEYFEREEHKQQQMRARGAIHLAGAVISPSDEDSMTFVVNAANGEIYRLRAFDAKERQHWVNRLRATAEHHTDSLAQNLPFVTKDGRVSHPQLSRKDSGSMDSLPGNRRKSESETKASTLPNMYSSAGDDNKDSSPPLSPAVSADIKKSATPKSSTQQANSGSNVSNASGGSDLKRNPSLNLSTRSRSLTGPKGVSERSAVVVLKRSQHKQVAHTSSSGSSSGPGGVGGPAVPPSVTPNPAQVITAAGSDECFRNVQEMMAAIQAQQQRVYNTIETIPTCGDVSSPLDKEMLLLKATSGATVACLEQCLSILQQQQVAGPPQPILGQVNNLDSYHSKPLQLTLPVPTSRLLSDPVSPADSYVSATSLVQDDLNADPCDPASPADALSDDDDDASSSGSEPESVGTEEEHKSVILHLLSQLKLGMDLTKVVLPTFILERRSLLELFADCMAHPDMCLGITDLPTPEARMIAVTEWYTMAFHAGKKGSVAKKPYNPIIGETFHCSWNVPPTFQSSQSQLCSRCGRTPKLTNGTSEADHVITEQDVIGAKGEGSNGPAQGRSSNGSKNVEAQDGTKLVYCAEQVSHHPPVSAFYFECPEKKICMNASIWTKSKFMGMSIGVVMVGKVTLRLLEHGEEYEFSLPSAYARSILTIPWVELGDRITISSNTGHSANVVFHTKPFYGGKLHKVTSEVRSPTGDIICRGSGEWNGSVEFTNQDGTSKVMDTKKMRTLKKCVRPLSQQGEYESRRLWRHVTDALAKNDVDTATQHKRFLEERQRRAEKQRKESNTAFPTKFFHKEGDRWVYNQVLKLETSPSS